MAEFLKRKEKGNATKAKVQEARIAETDAAFSKTYPALAEFLSLEAWDAETERERGTLTVFWEDGAFKASVNDRDADQVAFVSKPTFKTLLESIEKGLAADSLDWRQSKGRGPVKRK
jgi:hypothetical protein